jgi:chemotaxis protein MotA
MDIGTIIGILLGIALIVSSIMTNTSITTFVDIPSVAVVIGGTSAAALISFPLGHVFRSFSVAKKAFFSKPFDQATSVLELVKLAEVARRDGILSLETHLSEGDYDDFMVRGLRMAVDGQDRAVIESAMEGELEALMERHGANKMFFDNLGKYAPAFGMIGTVMGLVIMLQNMSDPESLGPAMAVAMITTFYGACAANLFAMPMADKLAIRSGQEVASKALIMAGVLAIQAGDNPRVVQQKLMAYLDAKQRKLVDEKLGS